MPPQTVPGLVHWPGVAQPLRASFTLSHGIQPSVCSIELVPQTAAPALDGTLAFSYDGIVVSFPGCRVKEGSLQYSTSGSLLSLAIEDYRWRWRFGEISGHWNKRTPDGRLQDAVMLPAGDLPDRLATPQQLAARLWAAMPADGSHVLDLSLLPNDTYPEVEWDAANPAQALDDLAESLGCRVVLQQGGLVRLIPLGLGGGVMSNIGLLQAQDTLSPPPAPRWVEVVGAPVRYQVYLLLKAVARDVDGTTVPVDQLSYKPAAGWGAMVPPNFQGLSGRALQCAQESLWKWYQVSDDSPFDADGVQGVRVGGWDGSGQDLGGAGLRVSRRWQLLPVEDKQVLTSADPFDESRRTPIPAAVEGVFYAGGLNAQNTAAGTQYTRAFLIDTEHGVVQFADPVWRFAPGGGVAEPYLYLVCAVSPRDRTTGEVTRFRYRADADPAGSGVQVIRRDDLQAYAVGTYSTAYESLGVAEGAHNFPECRQQAAYYAAAELANLQQRAASDRTYAAILDVAPDGAICQVGWEVGPEGCSTRLSLHSEWDVRVPTYAQRRADFTLNGARARAARLAEESRRRQARAARGGR